MKATDCSFEDLRVLACRKPGLSTLLSFIQVEYGLKELHASWDGFTESSAYYGDQFSDKWEVCLKFERELLDGIVEKSLPYEVGLEIHKISRGGKDME